MRRTRRTQENESQTLQRVMNNKKKRKSYRKDPDKLTLSLLQQEKDRALKIKNPHTSEYNTIWIRRNPSKDTKVKKRISKNTAYKRGRNFEYRVKKHFEQKGYYVVRKYASKGAEDLVAIKEMSIPTNSGGIEASEVFLIQCKNLKVERKLKRKDAVALINLAKHCGATPLLATNPNHKLTIVEVE